MRGLPDLVRWQLTAARRPWPRWVEVTPVTVLPPLGGAQLDVTFVNHATFLVRTPVVTVLTDPIWSERASPVSFAGPRRVHAPGIAFEALPRIDLVLLSHNHYDHLDLPTLRRLLARDRPAIVTGLGNRAYLQRKGYADVTELDWWQSTEVAGVRVTFTPARHFSARGPFDRNRTLWGGFVVEGGGPSWFFAGDTGAGDHFRDVHTRCGRPDLALLPIGAYEPRWFMAPVHMNPDDAVQAQLALGRPFSIAAHFGTFRLTDEARDEPARALGDALRAHGVDAATFRVPRPGETIVPEFETRAERAEEAS
jgi:L-ascorbate metabolism protein UlaG (beta-lactamase superfamily)